MYYKGEKINFNVIGNNSWFECLKVRNDVISKVIDNSPTMLSAYATGINWKKKNYEPIKNYRDD